MPFQTSSTHMRNLRVSCTGPTSAFAQIIRKPWISSCDAQTAYEMRRTPRRVGDYDQTLRMLCHFKRPAPICATCVFLVPGQRRRSLKSSANHGLARAMLRPLMRCEEHHVEWATMTKHSACYAISNVQHPYAQPACFLYQANVGVRSNHPQTMD